MVNSLKKKTGVVLQDILSTKNQIKYFSLLLKIKFMHQLFRSLSPCYPVTLSPENLLTNH